jgi:hypothetical protein
MLVGEGVDIPYAIPCVMAFLQQLVVLRASGPPPDPLSAMFARVGAYQFCAPHTTGLLAIEVIFPGVDITLRMLELTGLHDD